MSKLSDEYMQTSGVEEAVVSPEFQKNALRADHFVAVFAQSAEDFRFAMGKLLGNAGVGELLAYRIEQVIAYFE